MQLAYHKDIKDNEVSLKYGVITTLLIEGGGVNDL